MSTSRRGKASNGKAAEHNHQSATEQTHPARGLIEAIEHRALDRGHSVQDLAIRLGVNPSHWYRLRGVPKSLENCERATLVRISDYVGWPLLSVYLAAGILDEGDAGPLLGADRVLDAGLDELRRSPFTASVSTPLDAAAGDHQRLMVRLFLAAKGRVLEGHA